MRFFLAPPLSDPVAGAVLGCLSTRGYPLGLFRLFLALLVLVSHLEITWWGVNPGVTAVVVFYMLAGQVVLRLWLRMPHTALADKCRWFYRDRFLRIAPMYGFVLIFGIAAWGLGAQSDFLSPSPGWVDWLNNVLIVPLNFFMYNGSDSFTLLPPAWSLAAELQFYLLVPLLLAAAGVIPVAFILTLSVYLLAQLPILNTDVFGYRLLAGMGFVFLTGGIVELRASGRGHRVLEGLVLLTWLGLTVWCVALLLDAALREPFNLEVALGYVLGLPALLLLSRLHLRGWAGALQKLAGVLSYGVFLAHFPVMWLLDLYRPGLGGMLLPVVLGSLLVALLGHYAAERPVWHRHREFLRRG